MLSRRSFLGLMPPAAVLLCAGWPGISPGATPAESLPAREVEDLIRKWSFFVDEDWDASPVHETFLQGDISGVTECLREFDRYAS